MTGPRLRVQCLVFKRTRGYRQTTDFLYSSLKICLTKVGLTAFLLHSLGSVIPNISTRWKALNEIDVGACDGMTYADIHNKFHEEFVKRDEDKYLSQLTKLIILTIYY